MYGNDTLLTNARVATMSGDGAPYGLIDDGAVVISGEHIHWVGARASMPEELEGLPEQDLAGRLVTPALIDCHTHLVYGGNRAREFEMRLEGATYETIAREGGGILSTVSATRQASEDELIAAALPRVDAMLREGVDVVEIKSGYGLDLDTEMKMLRAARRIGETRPVDIRTTFLGAHALPPEYKGRADEYIDFVCETVLPAVHRDRLADAVDAFCEHIAFNPAQTAHVFTAARELGLPVKLHAEQLSDSGGAELAASFNALSADHLEYLDSDGVDAMAAGGTVAVLLPGAYYTLQQTQTPPVAALREAGVPMAVATDCNPGTSPVVSPLTALNMACTLFRLTPEEALAGMTRHAARALGLDEVTGTLEAGKRANIAVWNLAHPAELAYYLGLSPLERRIHRGRVH
ncbi:MAG TPA: imidazolonepropionase [Arenicellales bacterium]|nr:imidazolonepropionase [Arenicellales bacterium]